MSAAPYTPETIRAMTHFGAEQWEHFRTLVAVYEIATGDHDLGDVPSWKELAPEDRSAFLLMMGPFTSLLIDTVAAVMQLRQNREAKS